jgi:voltage-gated potassium channel
VGTQPLLALRALRLLRVFRILKLTHFVGESNSLVKALARSKTKILVFMFSVVILCIIFGTIMYMVEDDESGFTSIPRSIYWCIVTLTTVGYGDIAPSSPLGAIHRLRHHGIGLWHHRRTYGYRLGRIHLSGV